MRLQQTPGFERRGHPQSREDLQPVRATHGVDPTGKVPEENQLGHSVLVIEDSVGFICGYRVMPRGSQDRDVVVPELRKLQERLHGKIRRASFDQAFHSVENQMALAEIVALPCVPIPGVQGADQYANVEFRRGRQNHAGVESAINGLQAGNGLKRCRDHTELGYARYVGLGVLGRNLHVLGKVLLARESRDSEAARSKRKRRCAWRDACRAHENNAVAAASWGCCLLTGVVIGKQSGCEP